MMKKNQLIFIFGVFFLFSIPVWAQEASTAVSEDQTIAPVVDESRPYVEALKWYNALAEQQKREVDVKINNVTQIMIELHNLTQGFSEQDHVYLRGAEALMMSDSKKLNDVRLSRKVKKALRALINVKENRQKLNRQEDALMYQNFIEKISN